MAEVKDYVPGTPSWIDLGTPDLDASIEFYRGLFGWQIDKGPEEAGGYSMALLDGRTVAGIGPLMAEGQPPAWTTYVSVASAEGAALRVREAGGQVFVEPMRIEIGDTHFGTMAVMADPGGAPFSVWEPHAHIGAQLVNQHGALCWNELVTRDIEGAKRFYGAVFGWEGDTNEAGPTTYTEWKLGGKTVGGMLQMNEQWPDDTPSHWSAYFAVDNCEKAVAKAQELGATVMVEPTDIPGVGRFSLMSDPQGAKFTVISLIGGPIGG